MIVEDINLAQSEVLASLIPLLEKGELLNSQRAERLSVQDGFQMIMTVTCAPKGLTAGAYRDSDHVKVYHLQVSAWL